MFGLFKAATHEKLRKPSGIWLTEQVAASLNLSIDRLASDYVSVKNKDEIFSNIIRTYHKPILNSNNNSKLNH
jgi:hypothetical protein